MSSPFRHSLLFVAAGSLIAFTACPKEKYAKMREYASDAMHSTVNAISDKWNHIKNCSFCIHDTLPKGSGSNVLNKEFEAKASQLRADYSKAKASASRRIAINELKNGKVSFYDKMAALSTASADTWSEAKNNVVATWDKLQAFYAEACANDK